MLDLSAEELARGVTAVSAGKPRHGGGVRRGRARDHRQGRDAEVGEPVPRGRAAASSARPWSWWTTCTRPSRACGRSSAAEGRTFVHPFEGPKTALGTATLGLELVEQAEGLDAVIVPIGGGGLCAGVASAVKLASPRTLVFGVEPEGADSMHRSFAAGSPQPIDAVRTIADSLRRPARGALQLRPVPAVRGRPGAGERRRAAARHVPAVRVRQAGGGARRRRAPPPPCAARCSSACAASAWASSCAARTSTTPRSPSRSPPGPSRRPRRRSRSSLTRGGVRLSRAGRRCGCT